MQKKIIALAIAGLASTAAFAQSNVTVYGVMDVTQELGKASGSTVANSGLLSRSRLSSNSSNIGFKGSEALGNGLTAVFQIETGFNADAAVASSIGSRDTYVGLAGGFGTVVAGTLTHPVRTMGAKVDFNPGASSSGFTGAMYGEIAGVKTGSDERAQNAVAYVSPDFGGFTVTGAWVNGETRSAEGAAVGTKGRQYQLAGQYSNGPLYVGLGYHVAKDPLVSAAVRANIGAAALGAGTFGDELKVARLAAVYTLPSKTSFSALYDKQKYAESAAATATNVSRTAYMLGAKQSFGANDVWLQYSVARDLAGAAGAASTGAKQWTLGYAYNLSKRTVAHAFYTKLTNESGVAYDNYVNGMGLAYANRGSDNSIFGAGVRHSF